VLSTNVAFGDGEDRRGILELKPELGSVLSAGSVVSGCSASWSTGTREVEEAEARDDFRRFGTALATPRQAERFLSGLEAVDRMELCEGLRARVGVVESVDVLWKGCRVRGVGLAAVASF
jgi:hypothetical protein